MASKANVEVIIKGKDQASQALKGISGNLQRMSGQLRTTGLAMTAMGGAMVAAFGLAMKAAAAEEVGISRLSVAMRNVGLSYEDARESLEGWIDAQQQSTAFADDEQRAALASLVRITKDVTQAQDLLTLAMDVAIGTNKDLESATTLLMYALSGNWGMLERYIPAIKKAVTEEEKWLLLRKLFAGQAEEYGKTTEGQMKRLQANIGDLKEAIGGLLNEAIKPYIDKLGDMAEAIKKLDPKIMGLITKIGVGVAGTLTLTGVILLFLSQVPNIILGFKAIKGMVIALTAKIGLLNIAIGVTLGLLALLAVGIGLVAFGIYGLTTKTREQRDAERELNKEIEVSADVTARDKELVDSLGTSLDETAKALGKETEAVAKDIEHQKKLNDTLARQLQLRLALMKGMRAAAMAVGPTVVGKALEEYEKATGKKIEPKPEPFPVPTPPPFQYGGIMPYTGLAFLHKGETVIPANEPPRTETPVQIVIGDEVIGEVIARTLGRLYLERERM